MSTRTVSELHDVVQVDICDHIATVALNRPEVLNAVSTSLLLRLIETFDDINDSSDIWCVVLRGNGRAFSVGADQKERLGMSADDVRRRRRIAPRAFQAMRECIRPVIAQVHGYAIGSGLELALGCDAVVAAADTVIGLIETKVGAIPGGGATQVLPRLVGPLRARELIFSGRRFAAAEAASWGMFNYVVEPTELQAKVASLAAEFATSAPIANTQAKRALNLALDVDLVTGVQAESALYERTLTSADRAEALRAYRERREPTFEGR